MSDATENWKDVPGFEGRYCVSDLGRVYSLLSGRCLRPATGRSGHQVVALSLGAVTRYIHQLVLEAFEGPRPPEFRDCRHLNGDASDNRRVNLAWGSRNQNVRDRKWHGAPRKLTVEQVRDLKARLASRETHRSLSNRFSVSPGLISAIAAGKVHADV